MKGILERPDFGRGSVGGIPVIGTDDSIPGLIAGGAAFLIAIGQIRSVSARKTLFEKLTSLAAELPSFAAPSAYVSASATLGIGALIMEMAIVGPGAVVGDNCIINSRALLEHGVTIGNHCHVSTGALVNGNCRIGDGVFIGSGAVIRDGVTIGDGAFVGMGARVTRDLQAGGARYADQAGSDARPSAV